MKILIKQSAFFVFLFFILPHVDAQITPPLWNTAFGTCGGWWQNGGEVKAGSDGNIYMTYRYSGIINIGIPGHTVSPPNGGGGTSIGTGKFTNTLWGTWGQEVQSSGGNDYILGMGLDDQLNSYAGGIINSSAQGWFCAKTDVNGNFKWDIQSTTNTGYASGICTDRNQRTYICGPYNSATMQVLGHSIPSGGGASDGFVLKVNSAGQWDAYTGLLPCMDQPEVLHIQADVLWIMLVTFGFVVDIPVAQLLELSPCLIAAIPLGIAYM